MEHIGNNYENDDAGIMIGNNAVEIIKDKFDTATIH
jgi:hypothetical protein